MTLFLLLALILPTLSKAMMVGIPGLGSIKGTSSKSEKGLDFYKFLGRVCEIPISYTRWLHKRIHKTELKFWAVWGSFC